MEKYEAYDLILDVVIRARNIIATNVKVYIPDFPEKDTARINLMLEDMYNLAPKCFDKKPMSGNRGTILIANLYTRLLKEDGGFESLLRNQQTIEQAAFNSINARSAITNHYTITNSTNANIVSGSSQVSITQSVASQAKQILWQIRDTIEQDMTVDEATQKDIVECTREIENGIDNGKTPRFALRSLLEMASNLSSVASLAIQLTGLV